MLEFNSEPDGQVLLLGAQALAVVKLAVVMRHEKVTEVNEEGKVPALMDLEFHLGSQTQTNTSCNSLVVMKIHAEEAEDGGCYFS